MDYFPATVILLFSWGLAKTALIAAACGHGRFFLMWRQEFAAGKR